MYTIATRMRVIVDPGDEVDFLVIEFTKTEECVSQNVDRLGLFAALCGQINQHGVLDGVTGIWYPPHQIKRIEYVAE